LSNQDQPSKRLIAIVLATLIIVAALSFVYVTRPSASPQATVQFFSNNAQGYACFLNYAPLAPACMSEDPSTMLPSNVTLPVGNYSIVFFPFGTASNKSEWYGTNNIHVTGWAPYDASSSYANVTITGNGALVVFVLPENATPIPVPEFNSFIIAAFSALAASLYLLRRRRFR
jgi:hypothetical protein